MRKLWRQLRLPIWGQGPRGTRFALAFAGVLAGLAPVVLSAASFTASLDRKTITLGESATLLLTFEGGTQGSEPPALPAIPNLQIAYVSTSKQYSLVNDQVSSAVTYSYTVTPHQVGDYVIPALTAAMNGQKLTSQPLKLKVLKPGQPPPEAVNSGAQLAFARLVLPKKELYLGETVVAEIHIYVSDKVRRADSFRFTAIPAEGFHFSLDKMSKGEERRVQAGEGTYTEVPFSLALTPVKTGPLTLGPVTAGLVVELPSPNRRRDPIWDPFGMLDRSEQKAVSLATDAETVQVFPLPAKDAPPNFNGAVGSYTLVVSAGPTNVAAGDPITVKIQISGSGALDLLALPDQPAWRDFKVYPASAPKIALNDQLGISGSKTFEEVVVPQNADIKALPPFSFSYFDSDRKVYQTLTGPGIALAVRPGGATAVPSVAAANRPAQDNPPLTSDIVPIKQRLGAIAAIRPPLIRQPWFLGMQSVPALALITATLWRRRSERLANNPRLRRQRQVSQTIREGRNELRKCAHHNDSEAFFAILFRLLQEQLGERLDLPASAITEAVIEERLRPSGVPEPALASLHELFQTCNLARYAPIKTSQELAAFIPKVEAVLRQLQELKP